MIGRLLTIGALAVLAGNAMVMGPKLVEAAGLVMAIIGIAITGVVFLRARRANSGLIDC